MGFLDSLKGLFGGDSPESNEGGVAMITCEDALHRLQEFIDGELDSVPQAEVERHFEMCQRCYPHLRLEESFKEAMRRAASTEETPPELRQKVLDLLSEAESRPASDD